jgi:hypothetical protein
MQKYVGIREKDVVLFRLLVIEDLTRGKWREQSERVLMHID